MGNMPDRISEIINEEKPELTNLSILLNFFLTNKNNLSRREKRKIFLKAEKIREYYNTDRPDSMTVFRDGKEETINFIKKGYNIQVEELYPNDLYIEANNSNQFQLFSNVFQNLYLIARNMKLRSLGIFAPKRAGVAP